MRLFSTIRSDLVSEKGGEKEINGKNGRDGAAEENVQDKERDQENVN